MSKAVGPQKHLTLDERKIIKKSFKKIGCLKTLQSLLIRIPQQYKKKLENIIRKNIQFSIHYGSNKCAKRQTCHNKNVCNSK